MRNRSANMTLALAIVLGCLSVASAQTTQPSNGAHAPTPATARYLRSLDERPPPGHHKPRFWSPAPDLSGTPYRNGQNPEMQLAELRTYCERRGWEIAEEFVERRREALRGWCGSLPL